MLLVMFALRFAGVIFSYGTGVTGGIFAPMIALGTILVLHTALQLTNSSHTIMLKQVFSLLQV